jgi:hypothetical protein
MVALFSSTLRDFRERRDEGDPGAALTPPGRVVGGVA